MTGKERAALRAKANSLESYIQIGKSGISDALIKQVDDAITAHELIKIKVHLETTPISPREAADELAKALNADATQVIGGVIVLHRHNLELHKPKQANSPKNIIAKK